MPHCVGLALMHIKLLPDKVHLDHYSRKPVAGSWGTGKAGNRNRASSTTSVRLEMQRVVP